MSWPYSLKTGLWVRRRAEQLSRWPLCLDCLESGRGEVAAVEVVAIGSGLISVCAKDALRRRRTGVR